MNRLEDDDSSSRKTRLLRLCSYLQHKYKHMCRQERASIRQKKYRYAFRKALLHAASNNPDSAGQLIQELRGASRRWSRYCHKCPHLRHVKTKKCQRFKFAQSKVCLGSVASARQRSTDTAVCTGSSKGQACNNRALPFSQHCFQRILLQHL